jgi:hypothetical protein
MAGKRSGHGRAQRSGASHGAFSDVPSIQPIRSIRLVVVYSKQLAQQHEDANEAAGRREAADCGLHADSGRDSGIHSHAAAGATALAVSSHSLEHGDNGCDQALRLKMGGSPDADATPVSIPLSGQVRDSFPLRLQEQV